MTRQTLAQVLALLETAYGVTFSAEEQCLWYALLEPLDDEAARLAAIELCRESPHRPRPADLWGRAQEITLRRRRAPPRPALDIPEEQRRENLRRLAEMARELTARMSAPWAKKARGRTGQPDGGAV